MIGNSPYFFATSSSDCDFSRCCHSGVRLPGRARGISSARPAFSRKRAPNSALEDSSPTTRSSSSSGSISTSSAPGGSSASGRWTMIPSSDQIASASRSSSSRIRARQREPPGGVDAAAERAEDAQPPVADLVAEALDHDRPVGRDHAGRLLLLGEELEQVLGGERIEVVVRAGAAPASGHRRRGRTRRSPHRARAGVRRCRPSRTGPRPGGRAPA